MLVEYSIDSNFDNFKKIEGCKINYSDFNTTDAIQITPASLLFEKTIVPIETEVFFWKKNTAFFKTGNGEVPFDLFSATFFLISRYEEYLSSEKDMHGRFKAVNSFAYKNSFLQKPVIDLWCFELKKIIAEKFGNQLNTQKEFEYIATFDIDNAFAYKYKGVFRTVANSIREIGKLDFKQLFTRWKVILGFLKDPFDTYDYIFNAIETNELKSIFFFLIGDYHKHDKNLNYKKKRFKDLISWINQKTEVNIHPSYHSNKNFEFINIEKKRLELIVEKKIESSRQHYLKLSFPETYRSLINANICNDYTMGYSEQPGFRASTCTPFNFYDLEIEEKTNLKIYPFAYMEVTFHTYLKMNPVDSVKIIEKMIEAVKEVNGTFISIWHNETLSESKLWSGWRFVFESTVRTASKK